jgi:hypothetical protein
MTDSSNTDPPSRPERSADPFEVGYKKPPKHSQFPKGKSGNPNGRPKMPTGVSIKEILDGDQLGRNGEIVTRREAVVIRMLNDALAGNQKAFGRFLKLLKASGLKRVEPSYQVKHFYFDSEPMTPEEYERFKRNFGLPRDQWT